MGIHLSGKQSFPPSTFGFRAQIQEGGGGNDAGAGRLSCEFGGYHGDTPVVG